MSYELRPWLLALPLLAACSASAGELDSAQSSASALSAPGWMGNATYVISRATCGGGACDADRQALSAGYRFDDWAYSRAAITTSSFEVWQQGVTDWDNPNLWQTLDVRVYSRAGGTGAYAWKWVSFERRVGNNARYTFSLRDFDPFFDATRGARRPIATAADCPKVPFRVSADGLSVEVDVDLYMTVNGAELRPSAGATFRGTYTAPMPAGTCTGTPVPPAVVDSVGADTTVLKASLPGTTIAQNSSPQFSTFGIDLSKCNGTDCTAPAEEALKLPGATQVSPMIAPFTYTANLSGQCEILDIRTVTRKGALDAASFAGLGFYYKRNTSYDTTVVFFVPKARLHAVESVTLKDGAAAVVHRFVAPGMCFGLGGNGSAIYGRNELFKPFARFDVGTTQYRVWDNVGSDYLIGRRDASTFVTTFDRRPELVR